MLKNFIFLLFIHALFSISCSRESAPDAISSATQNKRAALEPLLMQIMPEAMADGIVKVAIVRNLTGGDYGRQFLESCIAEGRSMGFVVDSFVLTGDDDFNRSQILRIAAADYDGLIFSLIGGDLLYSSFLNEIDQRIRIVTFDNLPVNDDDPRKKLSTGGGLQTTNIITAAAQDDEELAEISLNVLVNYFASRPGSGLPPEPVRVIPILADSGITLMDSRNEVYNRFIREGKIIEVAQITPPGFAHIRSSIREELIKTLTNYPPGTVDAVWAPYDEFAKGCFDALNETGRNEIKLTSIDISNDTINLMMDHTDHWIASAATDPSIAGIVIMRLLAAKFAGENTPSTYTFGAQLIETSKLSHSVNMANIASFIPGWPSSQGLFEYPWMTVLKDCVAGKR